jgi:type VI secretion system secreted protein VgrG
MSDAGDTHLLSLTTSLGDNVLAAVSFTADEAISAPFAVEVSAVCAESSINPADILYKPACLSVVRPVGGTRLFNGMVRGITEMGVPERGRFLYRLSIVPKLWFLGQTSDCRIFQQETVGSIIETICAENGQTVDVKIFGTQTTQEYVTQYNETDLQFISRLMEQAGLFYYFVHTKSDHSLVVTDQNQGFPSGAKPLLAVVYEGGNLDTLTQWQVRPTTAWGSTKLFDYDPANPTSAPQATTNTTLPTAGAATRAVVQWPALSLATSVVTDRTRFMMQAAEAATTLIDSAGANHMLVPGGAFTLYRDPYTNAENVAYVVQSVRHRGTDETWIGGSGRAFYENSFTCFPSKTNWRQPLVTPRPVMAGVFAAIVLGDTGEEIHADSLGRIKVRLMWDHRNDTVADKAVWARIIQPWAGNSWGWQHLPRVGTEVAVGFMDGDPDRPVVLGGLYNANMQPVFAVPGEQTKSGIRSRSTTHGSSTTFSEFSIDDKKGSELVYLHAEKDLTTDVENNQILTVGANRTVTVTKDESITIDGNRTETVKKDESITINGKRTETVQEDESITINGKRTETVQKDESITINGGRTETVGKKESITVGQGRSVTISQGNDALTVSMGDLTIQVSVGGISMQALSKIELTVGGNSVKIDPSGVTVTGTLVKVQGQAMVQVQGPMIQTSADAMLMLKGAITMVN